MDMDTRVAISLFGLDVYWYGIIITFGMIVATYVAAKEIERLGYNPQILWDGAIWILALGVLGGRMYHVFSEYNDGTPGWSFYRQHPLEIITGFRSGGLGIFGGVLGGSIGAVIVAFRNKVPFGIMANAIAPGLLIGQAIGRWGNFANQELYGPPTQLPWGIRIADWARVGEYRDLGKYPFETTLFHPSFLYESLWNLIGFGLLLWLGRRFKQQLRPWDIFGIYMIWYGMGRAFLESFVRLDASTYGSGPLPTAVLFGLAFMAAGVVILLVNHIAHHPNNASAPVSY